jgi:hypothetical protein
MMMAIVAFLIVAALMGAAIKLQNTGMVLGALAAVPIALMFYMFAYSHFEADDYELWNGSISAKDNVRRNCPVGWKSSKDDFCTEYRERTVQVGESCSTDAKGNRSCFPIYDTEYLARYNWEGKWFISSKNLNHVWEIERVDAQGAKMPDKYARTVIGEAASLHNKYKNWVKPSADSLFHNDGEVEEKYKSIIPQYPIKLIDYFKAGRIISIGVPVPDLAEANEQLSNALIKLGPAKQMNAVIVVADASKYGPDLPYAIRRAWKGFKKNDAVMFIGVRDGLIEWGEVMSWSKASIFDVELREKILADRGKPLVFSNQIKYLEEVGMANYQRRSMKEFEYLKAELNPSILWTIGMIIAQILGALTVSGAVNHINQKYRFH